MKGNKYSALPLWEKLVNKVMIYYQTVWAEKRYNASNHNNWLENFSDEHTGDQEKLNALYLLSKFMFFGQYEIRELLLSIYRDRYKYKIVEDIRRRNGDTIDLALINSEFNKCLINTRFIGLGDYSESGSFLSYPFRQVNRLPARLLKHHTEIFENSTTLKEPNVTRYIFLDDFCGSGETAVNYSYLVKRIKHYNPMCEISYYTLFITEAGNDYVRRHSAFDNIESIFLLDRTFKCFETGARYFSEGYPEVDQAFAKVFAEKYGVDLVIETPVEGHPLGFDDGQLLLSFSHNTPDNSLPIFWGERNWNYYFKRYIKIK